jgi:hypothetical protein
MGGENKRKREQRPKKEYALSVPMKSNASSGEIVLPLTHI